MKFVERVSEGAPMPWTHRIAWIDYPYREAICMPLGLHYLARIGRWFWIQSFRWRPDAWAMKCREIDRRYREAIREKNGAMEEAIELIARLTPMGSDDLPGDVRSVLDAEAAQAGKTCKRLRKAIAAGRSASPPE